MVTEKKEACIYCGSTTEDLRPYAIDGQMLCHPCMMADPERKAEDRRRAIQAFDNARAADSRGSVFFGDDGPVPLDSIIGEASPSA